MERTCLILTTIANMEQNAYYALSEKKHIPKRSSTEVRPYRFRSAMEVVLTIYLHKLFKFKAFLPQNVEKPPHFKACMQQTKKNIAFLAIPVL